MRTRALLAAIGVSLLALAPTAAGEIVQKGGVRVALDGALTPHALPREDDAPVGVSVGARITTADGSDPPQLRRIEIAINSHGRIDHEGLPACTVAEIQPSTTALARAACGASLVGTGTFSADVELAHQSPFPSSGRVLAFFGFVGCEVSSSNEDSKSRSPDIDPGRGWPGSSRTQGGRGGERAPARDRNPTDRGQRDAPCHPRPAILAHVYGTNPIPTSYTLPLLISERGGRFGTELSASLPAVTEDWGFVTGLQLTLRRSFSYRGSRHSFLSASCPAPKGFPGAVFPLLKASFRFAGVALSSTLTRSCGARG